MTTDADRPAYRICDRVFTAKEVEWIRHLIASDPALNRAQLSRVVCDELGWRRLDGGRKDMSCRVAMLRMHRNGLITLPPPQKGNGNGRHRPGTSRASDPQPPITLPVGTLGELSLRIVQTPSDSRLCNELLQRYHYLGYKPLPGAQLRYLVFAQSRLLAVLGFGAAAWAVAPRDRFIGWTPEQRQRNLHLIVNNARFLILPWVSSHNLASRILSKVTKRLGQDWLHRYGYQPVLAETFVEQQRFPGTCYRAANWIHVGQTQGRGKLDRRHRHPLTVKSVFLYPLRDLFRQKLRV